MDTTDTTNLFRVFKTALKMLSDRKYIIKPEDLAMTLEEFKAAGKTYTFSFILTARRTQATTTKN